VNLHKGVKSYIEKSFWLARYIPSMPANYKHTTPLWSWVECSHKTKKTRKELIHIHLGYYKAQKPHKITNINVPIPDYVTHIHFEEFTQKITHIRFPENLTHRQNVLSQNC
jgi:hypothetical protein